MPDLTTDALDAAMSRLGDDQRRALLPLTSATRKLGENLAAGNAAGDARAHEQARLQAEVRDALREVRDALRALVPSAPGVVGAAVDELQVAALHKATGLLDLPQALGRWLAADRTRAGLLLVSLAGVGAQLADGAPVLATLGRALLAVSSPGGATP